MFLLRRLSDLPSPSFHRRGHGNSRSLSPHSSPLSPSSPAPQSHCCTVSSLEEVVLQCPLSQARLRELCEHLIHSDCDINEGGRHSMTPLHLAIQRGDEPCTKLLLAFGADINACSEFDLTPLDIAYKNRIDDLIPLLVSCGCVTAESCPALPPAPALPSFPRPSHLPLTHTKQTSTSTPVCTAHSDDDGTTMTTDPAVMSFTRKTPQMLCTELERGIERQLDLSTTLDPDQAMALVIQQKELNRMRRTQCGGAAAASRHVLPWATPMSPGVTVTTDNSGCRILSLDGGGIRGLIQIEVLSELERLTGRRIRDLFDCIIGTSTGGIIALAIVYYNKPLSDLRRLYFRMREQVFRRSRMGVAHNSTVMENILKEELGDHTHMMDVTHPKVLVSAVDKSAVQPKLCFFNNCFDDEFSTQLVWKVARYTSAAPTYFTECDNFVDGGFMANNPCDSGLTRLQQFHSSRGERMTVSCVVSVGSGISPSEPLGPVDAELNLRRILHLGDNIRRTTNLLKLLSHALVESEEVARKCRSHCETHAIPYFRFSPRLNAKIESSETDIDKLLEMIMQTKIETTCDPQLHCLQRLLLQLLPVHEEDSDDYDEL